MSKLLPAYKDVPERFKRFHDPYVEFIGHWFFRGADVNALRPRDGVDAPKALRHISACMRSFEPKHEHKEAGCAYLLHEWFELVSEKGERDA